VCCPEISRVLKDDNVTVYKNQNENLIVFTGENYEVFTSIIDGQYPNYMAVVPKTIVGEVQVDSSFKSSLERILIPAVKVEVGEGMILSALSEQCGEIRETLPLIYKGEELKTAFNAHYVIDALKMMPEATMSFGGALAPALFKTSDDDNYTIVVVPLRA
jgi:DNA polymerase-3 subunit beta